jgi:UDPglucose 6-dehydrogenase
MKLSFSAERHHVVGVIGLGYVGLVTAATLASLGHDVVCVDIDAERIRRLRAGDVPLVELGLPELLHQHRERLTWSLDAADVFGQAPIVFVTVDTPGLPSGDADLSRVESVIDRIPDDVPPMILAMKSTVPVGTGARVQRHLQARGLDQVTYVSNPEFLREGTALRDVMHPDRVVVGADDRADADEVARLWAPLGGQLRCCDLASAEMIKLAANAFLATKISFVNEIANVCENVGADVAVVAEGMGLDRRIGADFLEAGLGYGGSCFPKDVAALKQLAGNSGYHFQLLSAVIEVNELQKRRVVSTLAVRLGRLAGARVALLGISFKPGTDDVRESPALVLAERLTAEGASVVAHDPVAGAAAARVLPEGVRLTRDLAEAVAGADAAVIVTAWPQYGGLLEPGMSASMSRPLLVDGRNMLDPCAAAHAGYEWVGIGRPESAGDSAADVTYPMVRAQ